MLRFGTIMSPTAEGDYPSGTPENRKAYPDGFWHECCEAKMNAPPCTTCPHKAKARSSKKKACTA